MQANLRFCKQKLCGPLTPASDGSVWEGADCKSAKCEGLTASLSRALLSDLITERRGPVALRVSLEIASVQSAETDIDHPASGDIAPDRTTAPYSKISFSLFSLLLKTCCPINLFSQIQGNTATG